MTSHCVTDHPSTGRPTERLDHQTATVLHAVPVERMVHRGHEQDKGAVSAEAETPVILRRRTLPDQVEHLLFQVALNVAEINRLKDDNEVLIDAVKSLENRVAALERVTPLKKPFRKAPPAMRTGKRLRRLLGKAGSVTEGYFRPPPCGAAPTGPSAGWAA